MKRQAGQSARKKFRDLRAKNLRREWKLWSGFLAFGVGTAFVLLHLGRTGLVLGGWMLGFVTAVALFGWMIAFDVHAVTHLWGSWGEEQTEEVLRSLGPEWFVRHDVENDFGNWDHVAIGPPGVFMIDTKRLHGRETKVTGDGISAGRTRFDGATFRGASVGLRKALIARADQCPFVQAVVAIWGEFEGEPKKHEKVVYLSGASLVDWLESRPPLLAESQRAALAAALQDL